MGIIVDDTPIGKKTAHVSNIAAREMLQFKFVHDKIYRWLSPLQDASLKFIITTKVISHNAHKFQKQKDKNLQSQ